jgi:hypothetical protein
MLISFNSVFPPWHQWSVLDVPGTRAEEKRTLVILIAERIVSTMSKFEHHQLTTSTVNEHFNATSWACGLMSAAASELQLLRRTQI